MAGLLEFSPEFEQVWLESLSWLFFCVGHAQFWIKVHLSHPEDSNLNPSFLEPLPVGLKEGGVQTALSRMSQNQQCSVGQGWGGGSEFGFGHKGSMMLWSFPG